jgi:UDPglucose 6-dehydrogenase/UDP-N-acetyl-D-galactosamine dehydrogenase
MIIEEHAEPREGDIKHSLADIPRAESIGYKPSYTLKDGLKDIIKGGFQMNHRLNDKTVCIAGLGYVGLPLALAFSRHLPTIGFDVDAGKIRELSGANDNPGIAFTDNPEEIGNADFIIIAVPTPVTKSKDPDISYIESAARTIGTHLKRGATVVLESTVYPGVTEEVLKPILEHESGLICGTDFKIGYSPERINPNFLRKNLVKPSDIPLRSSRIIALVNELSLIFGKMGLSTTDVLEAAGTKWNFHLNFGDYILIK